MLVERLPMMRWRSGALILLTPTSAYKLFIGHGAQARCDEEYDRFSKARLCPVWGGHLMPVSRTRLRRVLHCRRGNAALPAGDERGDRLCAFVEARIRAAMSVARFEPAVQLIDFAKLQIAIGEIALAELLPTIKAALAGSRLPSGPTHGDLHRGNVLVAGGSYVIIDCNRYHCTSSPIFDQVHFELNERRRQLKRRWVDLLGVSDDIVHKASSALGGRWVTPEQVALSYGLTRIAHEGYEARQKGFVREKYATFARSLVERYATRVHGCSTSAFGETEAYLRTCPGA